MNINIPVFYHKRTSTCLYWWEHTHKIILSRWQRLQAAGWKAIHMSIRSWKSTFMCVINAPGVCMSRDGTSAIQIETLITQTSLSSRKTGGNRTCGHQSPGFEPMNGSKPFLFVWWQRIGTSTIEVKKLITQTNRSSRKTGGIMTCKHKNPGFETVYYTFFICLW